MADLKIYEKYPDSWRIDHPDFMDVFKVTFAKGVITDFEKVNDVPLQVKSRVKVQGEWGESDFIPLFYHPKFQYWDDPNGSPLATDYNEEGGYFERAWMSFRGDDEVAVMLKEGVPVAVVGFADGKPKIGEDIVKVAAVPDLSQPDLYYSASQGFAWVESIDNSEKGPDGLLLNLTEQAKYYPGNIGKLPNWQYWNGVFPFGCSGDSTPPDDYIYVQYEQWDYIGENLQIGAWVVIIGPILYVFLCLLIGGGSYKMNRYLFFLDPGWDQPMWDWCYLITNDPFPNDIPPPSAGSPQDEWITGAGSPDMIPVVGFYKAGIYSEALLAATIASIGSIDPLWFYNNIGIVEDLWPGAPTELIYQWPGGIIPATTPDKVKLYFKPHN